MVTPSNRAADLLAAIQSSVIEVTWRTPDDLSRRSVEAMVASGDGARLPSHGFLHLTGPGVSGSSALMDDVARLMSGFQRLVTAWGASLEGITTLRGKINNAVKARTRLRLIAGVAPGSVVLNITPDMPPAEELAPDGQEAMIDQPVSQRLDLVLEQVATLVGQASAIGPDATGSEVVKTIRELGPRTASSLRSLTDSLSSGGFDLDVEWAEPNKPTYRGSITAVDAGRVSKVIAGRELDRGQVTMIGLLHTSSDGTTRWEVEVLGESYKVGRGQVTPEAIHAAHPAPGHTVRITANVSLKEGLGEDKLVYQATSIEVVDPSTPQSITE
jgi:hypothetical protein